MTTPSDAPQVNRVLQSDGPVAEVQLIDHAEAVQDLLAVGGNEYFTWTEALAGEPVHFALVAVHGERAAELEQLAKNLLAPRCHCGCGRLADLSIRGEQSAEYYATVACAWKLHDWPACITCGEEPQDQLLAPQCSAACEGFAEDQAERARARATP